VTQPTESVFQQYQSTEETQKYTNNTKIQYVHTHTKNTANPLVYTDMG